MPRTAPANPLLTLDAPTSASATEREEPYLYADNAATTPICPEALDAMTRCYARVFGNPSGIHTVAAQAASTLLKARTCCARNLGAAPEEIFFTSGGSESDTWAITGAVERFRDLHGPEAPLSIITSAIEHHAVLHTCDALARNGAHIIALTPDRLGRVSAEALEDALKECAGQGRRAGIPTSCALVSIMLANNEVGTIEDIATLCRVAHRYGAAIHTDAVQAVGHIPVSAHELGVDALSLSGHKFNGPRGTGLLYLRDGFSIPPLVKGGAQERGLRAGTENLPGICGLAAALNVRVGGDAGQTDTLKARGRALARKRDHLVERICSSAPDVMPTGASSRERLPGMASFICKNVDGELLVMLLDRMGVAAATGSACSTGSTEPSHVIRALGVTDPAWARGTLRLSLSPTITDDEVELMAQRTVMAIRKARLISTCS